MIKFICLSMVTFSNLYKCDIYSSRTWEFGISTKFFFYWYEYVFCK